MQAVLVVLQAQHSWAVLTSTQRRWTTPAQGALSHTPPLGQIVPRAHMQPPASTGCISMHKTAHSMHAPGSGKPQRRDKTLSEGQ